MKTFSVNPNKQQFSTAFLIKESALKEKQLNNFYIQPLKDKGVDVENILFVSLKYMKGKVKAADGKDYLDQLLPLWNKYGISKLLICDAPYYKLITKKNKSPETAVGIPVQAQLNDYSDSLIKVMYGINYAATLHNPNVLPKLERFVQCAAKWVKGTYVVSNPVKSVSMPDTLEGIKKVLTGMLDEPRLAVDTETFGLYFREHRVGTIGFSPNTHSGTSFLVDAKQVDYDEDVKHYCEPYDNQPVKALLRWFFETYTGKTIYHNINFDVRMLAYWLYVDGVTDPDARYEAQLTGVDILLENAECTQSLTYLATNNTIKNTLGLKEQAQEFAGDYAEEDIKDIRLIPLPTLCQYNVIDCCSTLFTYDKHLPTVIEEKQDYVYNLIFKPAFTTLVNMELNGMPMSVSETTKQKQFMESVSKKHTEGLLHNPLAVAYTHERRLEQIEKDNLTLKTKERTMEEVQYIQFNSGSPQQLGEILHDYLGFPIQELTKTGQPSTGVEILEGMLAGVVRNFGLVEEDYIELHEKR